MCVHECAVCSCVCTCLSVCVCACTVYFVCICMCMIDPSTMSPLWLTDLSPHHSFSFPCPPVSCIVLHCSFTVGLTAPTEHPFISWLFSHSRITVLFYPTCSLPGNSLKPPHMPFPETLPCHQALRSLPLLPAEKIRLYQ